MDIKEYVEKAVQLIEEKPELKEHFKKDPVSAVKSIIGDKIPEEIIDKVIDGVKAKISVDDVKDKLGALGKLF